MEHPATSVLGSRRLVLIGGPRCMRGVPETDQMHRILDRFARTREEHEKKQRSRKKAKPGREQVTTADKSKKTDKKSVNSVGNRAVKKKSGKSKSGARRSKVSSSASRRTKR